MTSKARDARQRAMQRLRDGDLSGDERRAALKVAELDPEAALVLDALEEVELAATEASALAWERSSAPSAAALARAVWEAPALGTRDLGALAPLLDRFHDGEASEQEASEVLELIKSREDVRAYVDGLAALRGGVVLGAREAAGGDDLGAIWEGISERLGFGEERDAPRVIAFPGRPEVRGARTAERPAFEIDDHQVLLYRCRDHEATEAECAQAKAWAEIDGSVSKTIAALDEISLATRVAAEMMGDKLDAARLWERIDAELTPQQEGAIDLAAARRARRAPRRSYLRELGIAAAAAIVAVLGFALMRGPEVIEKTVVIVDSIESAPGATVRVTGGARAASADARERLGALDEGDEEEPMVIWLVDPDGEPRSEPASDVGADSGQTRQPI